MARTKNPIRTVAVTITTTPPVAQYLEDLVDSGLYGKNRSEAAERLVANGLERMIREGTLKRKSKTARRRQQGNI